MKFANLEIDKPYKIVEATRVQSKYHPESMQTVVQFDNGHMISLPSRFNDMDEDMFHQLESGNVSLIVKGQSDKTWIVNFAIDEFYITTFSSLQFFQDKHYAIHQ